MDAGAVGQPGIGIRRGVVESTPADCNEPDGEPAMPDGKPVVKLTPAEQKLLDQARQRTKSDPSKDPVTGAELGANGKAAPRVKVQPAKK